MAESTIARHHRLLLDLTAIPTASGCEQGVVEYIESHFARRKNAILRKDRFGNLHVTAKNAPRKQNPIIVTAHLDHPAFVVAEQKSPKELIAEFRGGVADEYFSDSRVRLYHPDGRVTTGVVVKLLPAKKNQPFKKALIRFGRKVHAEPGQMMTWQLPRPRVVGGRLRAPVCDDLAAVAAALEAFDCILKKRNLKSDVRLLFTRAEEVGFVGAIATAKHHLIPARARLITLENSKSFAHDSPIGGGPILRVGDRISIFDDQMARKIAEMGEKCLKTVRNFQFQRKLMPGGACETTAFKTYAYDSICLCLPLGNYHNMNEATGRIDSETISLSDYDNLIHWLVKIATNMDKKTETSDLQSRLDKLFDERSYILK